MTCKECRSLIIKYSCNEISAREQEEMYKHVENCNSCLFEMISFNRLMKIVSGLPELHPSPFFESSLRAKLSQVKLATEPKRWFKNKKFAFVGAISLILILAFSLYLYRVSHESDAGQVLTAVESELIKYDGFEGDNIKHFVMPSVRYHENFQLGTDNFNENKDYILTLVNTSDESNYILDKIVIYPK